jgi:ribosomal protein S18 acetylase RimI-like enzyme
MKKMTDILSKVDVKVQPLNSELIYLTENEKQVGSLILIYSGDDASIFSVQVLDNHRGKGYGKKLVEKAINICKTKGFKKIELNTEQDNQVANSMYRKMGFKLEGLKDNFNNYIKMI